MGDRRPSLGVLGWGSTLVSIALVAGGCGGGSSDHNFGSFVVTDGTTVVNGVELPHKATIRFNGPEKLARFRLSLDSARIVVEADAKVTGIEAEFEVRERTPGDASLVATGDTVTTKSAGGNPVLVVSATIRVAPSTALDVSTSFGTVTVSGADGAPSVNARSDSGDVELRNLRKVATVGGRSSFGKVGLIEGDSLGEVTLTTDSGSVTIEGVEQSTTVTLSSSFGSVKALRVHASESLAAKTDSGSVGVEDVRTGRAELRSSFGNVTALRSTFDHVDAHTDSGGVRLKACTYKTKDLGTDFGRVTEDD